MLKLIRNKRGEAMLGVFLVLFFLLMVGGKIAEDHRNSETAPAMVNATQGDTH